MTITEVSKRYNISTCTLWFYEKIGLIPCVQRTKKEYRNYTEEDCQWIFYSITLKNIGISTDVLIKYTDLFQLKKDNRKIMKQIFQEQNNFLEEKINEIENISLILEEKIFLELN